ncbi:MAG: hypothetical protein EOO40_12420, partial [Deltaproteobacteria bacterium]
LRVCLDSPPVTRRDGRAVEVPEEVAGDVGDPVVRRRDGAVAYHLACVVDDAAQGVTRVVRGKDLATSTVTQVALQRLLGLPTPVYLHHPLLLDGSCPEGRKFSKREGAQGVPSLRRRYSAAQLCGALASRVGLVPADTAVCPRDLVRSFCWSRVATHDLRIEEQFLR